MGRSTARGSSSRFSFPVVETRSDPPTRRCLRSSSPRYTPPTTAVTTPTGSWADSWMRWDAKSAVTTRNAPVQVAARRLGPGARVRRRASWGAMRATNGIGPAAAVATAQAAGASTRITNRVRWTGTPSPPATSSPISRIFSRLAASATSGSTTSRPRAAGRTSCQPRPLRLPLSHTMACAAWVNLALARR